ncbi:cyclohexanecarboxylate-CoA ligase [soil metagenome]
MLAKTRTTDIDDSYGGIWEGRTLSSFLDVAAHSAPTATAISSDPHCVSYRELRDATASLAAAITQRWVRPHDVVTVFLPNWPETVLAIHAVTWAGCVVSPVVTTYRRAELTFILAQSRSRVIFIPHVFRGFDFVELVAETVADMADPPAVIVVRPQGDLPEGFIAFDALLHDEPAMDPIGDPSDICLLLYTSGTTSQPKGVLHSHQTIVWEMRSIIRELQLGGGDGTFMASPLGHLTGIVYGVYLPVMLTESTALLDIWDADTAADIIERFGCRVSLGATPFLRGLTTVYERRGIVCSLRVFICGGADVPPDVVMHGSQTLGCLVTRTYGLSEMPTFSISGTNAPLEQRAYTDGTPVWPAEGHLINVSDGVGELVVRGPELFLGYLDPALNEDAFTSDGYFRTGDLVSIDARGVITVRGRMKDIIIRGGENISALEIEDHLRDHVCIEDVAVVGYPDTMMGERVAAYLVVSPGFTEEPLDIGEYLKSRGLAAHKRPELIHVVAELPRTASGKVQKQLLRAQAVDSPQGSRFR